MDENGLRCSFDWSWFAYEKWCFSIAAIMYHSYVIAMSDSQWLLNWWTPLAPPLGLRQQHQANKKDKRTISTWASRPKWELVFCRKFIYICMYIYIYIYEPKKRMDDLYFDPKMEQWLHIGAGWSMISMTCQAASQFHSTPGTRLPCPVQ